MSKDITIEKVGVPQELNGVKKIITNSPDFFQATWIPEESTKPIGKLTIHRNGHYEASDFYAYGFDEVEVDVPQTPPEIEGIIDWGIPPIDIEYPDIDINIDDFDIGDIDIDIPDIDPMDIDLEDLEIIIKDIIIDIIDDLDIDIDIDDIDIDIPDIDLSDFTPEELKDLIDDIIKDIIKDILENFDIDDIDIDVPDVDVKLPDVEIPDFPSDLAAFSHIDENGNIVGITKQDLEDMGKSMEDIAAMEDPVITIDDLGNIGIVDSFDVDDFGGVEVIDLAIRDVDLKVDGIDDDGRTKFVDEYLPTSIELTVPPNKLVYHDGEPIDLTGAIVSAKYKGGTAVWANEKYKNGIIPLGELIIEPDKADGDQGVRIVGIFDNVPLHRDRPGTDKSAVSDYLFTLEDYANVRTNNVTIYNGNFYMAPYSLGVYCGWKKGKYHRRLSTTQTDNLHVSFIEDDGNYYLYLECDDLDSYTGNHNHWTTLPSEEFVYDPKGTGIITLSWHRPKDGKILTTSFEITIE